ncbi:putative HD-GYP domain containing protein [Brachyspira hampsonii 30446]|uniref:Putative HD-GYP domain containing protein n=2 Tax=Brachyspira hampsonii TaxID=1287055 RepID=A0A2U4FSI9_9SPIR|nr:HD-GYP domain-containing protein [Brachyspira hampsonii]EKV58243.1 putative HD-GYP domain containing protein [Brachyspira hampsonii 30446]OEJ20228.1 diguanylate cyclase [Brachyspira hampsonii]
MAKLTKINTQDIKAKAEKKDIYLYNDFLASTGYVDFKEDDMQRLKKWDINEVFIEDNTSLDMEVSADFDKFLREYKVFKKIYFNVIKKVRNNLGGYKNNNLVNINELNEILDEVLDIANRNLSSVLQLFNLTNFPKSDEYYVRSLNVSLISMIIGRAMKFSENRVKKLGIGAILYDIGLVKVPDKILGKIGKFTSEEYAEVKKHTVYGYKILKSSFRFEEDLAMISLMHHEFYNGKGYPRGLSGNQINLYSKIVAIAHAVEKMLKPMRIASSSSKSKDNKSTFSLMLEKSNENKKKYVTLYDAVKEIIHGANTKYDPNISKTFVSIFTVYPIGSIVLLNDKRKGFVFAANPNFPIRPIIKIVSNENGEFIEDGETINLLETNQLFIAGVDKDNNFLEEVRTRILDAEEKK